VWRYRWNGAGLLHEVQRPDRQVVRFAYDSFARRVDKTLLEPVAGARYRAKSHTRFVWDGDVLAHEIKIAAQDGGNPVVAERTYLYEDDSFEPVAHQEDGRWVHYVNDQIGTPERLLESGGDVACELRRRAWGQTEVLPGATASTPIRFQGQYADGETELSYNRWRYYDDDTGRFASRDPSGLAGGYRAFSHVRNTQSWRDPLGLTEARGCDDAWRGVPLEIQEKLAKAGLPRSGQYPFKPKLTKNRKGRTVVQTAQPEKGPRRNDVGRVDENGDVWLRHPDEQHGDHWDKQVDGGADHVNVNDDGSLNH